FSLFCRSAHPRALPSFPTRRSSDLACARALAGRRAADAARRAGRARGAAALATDRDAPALRALRPLPPALLRRPPHPHPLLGRRDRKSTRLNSSHVAISYAVFCLKK